MAGEMVMVTRAHGFREVLEFHDEAPVHRLGRRRSWVQREDGPRGANVGTCSWALLCKYPVVNKVDGRSSAVVILDEFQVQQVPFALPEATVMARIAGDGTGSDRATVRLSLVGPDGGELFAEEGEEYLPAGARRIATWDLAGIVLPAFGAYRVVIEINGAPAAVLGFDVLPEASGRR